MTENTEIFTLSKPCSNKERADFIVEYNHRKGMEIIETDTEIRAVPYKPKQEDIDKARIQELQFKLSSTDYIDNKILEAIALEDNELLAQLKSEYKDKLLERAEVRKELSELKDKYNG